MARATSCRKRMILLSQSLERLLSRIMGAIPKRKAVKPVREVVHEIEPGPIPFGSGRRVSAWRPLFYTLIRRFCLVR